VQRKESEDCTVVECFGRLTSENVPLLKDAMREACEKKVRIVLDLREVPMMDSSGLRAVVTLQVSARTRDCSLKVVNASKQILELFRAWLGVRAALLTMVWVCQNFTWPALSH
jgi:anti-anti-sigma factor